jgi:hypothetical protein
LAKKYILFVVLLGLSFSSFGQSPWVDNKGSIYLQGSRNSINYTSIFNNTGGTSRNDFTTVDRTFSLYGSYSITNRTGVLVNLPYKSVRVDTLSLSALGDLSIKVKHQLGTKTPLAIFAGYTAPTATREGALRTGFAQHSVDLGLSTGFTLEQVFGYVGGGYRYRANIPNQFIIDAELGTSSKIGKRELFIIFHIDGAINFREVEDPEASESVLYHNNGQFVSPGIKFSLGIAKNLFINFGGFGAFTATSQGAAASVSLGLAYNMKK